MPGRATGAASRGADTGRHRTRNTAADTGALPLDPLSQGALGAAASRALAKAGQPGRIAMLGALGGLAPDLDVLIQSPADPLLFLEYHRQFTHSLIFIPVGALLVAAVAWPLFARRHLSFLHTWLCCLAGYATHGLLDACTTYGTMLFWPFSDMRVAWNNVSIVDPLFTLPILALVVTAALRRQPRFAQAALVWAVAYLALGIIQRDRAEAVGAAMADGRGHNPVRLEAKPSFGNLLVWKIVYEAAGEFYVDAVYAGLQPVHYAGASIAKLDVRRDLPWLDPASQQARDLERFRWFSNDYLGLDAAGYVIDMRYSMVPNEIDALWKLALDPAAAPTDHARYITARNVSPAGRARFAAMVFGKPLPDDSTAHTAD